MYSRTKNSLASVCLLLFAIFLSGIANAEDAPAKKVIKALFLGDNGHHKPADRFAQLKPVMSERGIEITYTANAGDLNPENLAKYDCLVIYANTTKIESDQEKALLDYVAAGKGFVPLHCASYCFLNSPKYIELVGAQFLKHGTGEFNTTVAQRDHPIMKGLEPFRTWDETYVHTKHNADRTVLQTRKEGDTEEPWTWVRNVGKGRVFYTAYGHDERTWSNPGFQALVERGIRWACGDDKPTSAPVASRGEPEMTPKRTDVKPFEYVDADVPFYVPGGKWGEMGKEWKKMQVPLDPAESIKHLVVPKGFEAKLFAADPQIAKPIAMAWDHRGRLWIAETLDYPNDIRPEGEGRDRIKICEDTDGDGVADKFTIFAENLNIPTSLTFANGGLIVQMAPQTLFLKDTDGDDKADVRQVLFSGWGKGDTHAGPSNLHYAMDNWIWGIVGYSSFSGEVGGEKLKFGAGFYRFKPDGSKMEFLRSNNNNSWGLGFSEEGLAFGSTANNNPSVYMSIPNRYYESVRGWSTNALNCIADSNDIHPVTEKVRQVDAHGKFTAGAGHALYTARALPKEYWNRVAIVNEPTGHVAATFVLEKKGSTFTSRNAWNVAASDDEWTAPIMTEVGPDGQLWMIDWYNYIIQHNPVPQGFKNGKGNAYDTPLRDHSHGRIYRLVYKDAKPYQPLKLDPKDGPGLVAALKNDNMFWRTTAQRLLIERGNADVVPALIALTQDNAIDELGLNVGAIHALWTLQGLKSLDGSNAAATAAALAALKHPSAGVRRNAVNVLPRNDASASALLAAGSHADSEPLVRLAAFLALAEMPRSDAAATAIASSLSDPINISDKHIPDAMTAAAAANDVQFLKAVASMKLDSADGKAIELIARVAEHTARGGDAAATSSVVMALVGGQRKACDTVIGGLSKGSLTYSKTKLDESVEKALLKLISECSADAKGQVVGIASHLGSTELDKYTAEIGMAMLEKARNEKISDADRVASAVQLIELRKADAESAKELLKLITVRSSLEFAAGILDAVRRSDSAELGTVLVGNLATLTPAVRQRALVMLLGRADWTEALVKGAEQGKVQLSELSLDQKQSLASHPNKAIAESAKKLMESGGGLPDADRQKVIDELAKVVLHKADAAKGKDVFKANCAKCHMHSGEGAKIGPDLTGMSAHPKSELLIHIFDPSRSVEGNFRQYTVITNDGQVKVGLLSSETKTSIEILDSEAKVTAIQRDNIKKLMASTKSLMPEGFEKQIPQESIADLLEFLTARGKFMPLDLHKSATIVSTLGMFINKDAQEQRLVFPDWSPKTFDGVPFNLVDPQGDKTPNVIMLYGPTGTFGPTMPKSVSLPCNAPAKAIHFLSGVSGWGATGPKPDGSVTMIVRLRYANGKTEDHPLKDGVHFADYIREINVPESKLAFKLRGQQIRYFAIHPKSNDVIENIELVKGPDHTVPVVMAVTVETVD